MSNPSRISFHLRQPPQRVDDSIFHLRRAARHKSGFWTEPPHVRSSIPATPIPQLGLTCAVGLSENLLDASSLGLQEGAARWRDPATNKLVGVAEFKLLRNVLEIPYPDHTVIQLMDDYSEEAMEFALGLSAHFASIGELLQNRGSVVHFTRLEMHPKWHQKGQGVAMGAWLMDEIYKAFRPNLYLLEPFPLQYRTVGARGGEPGEVLDEEGFSTAREKLNRLYETHWNAVRLDERYSAVAVHGDIKAAGNKPIWVCEPRSVAAVNR